MTALGSAPAWLARSVRNDMRSAVLARWGFRHETWIVERPDGGRVVVQRRADGSDPTLAPHPAIREAVRGTGVPVPEPVLVGSVAEGVVVTLPFVAGTVAADLFGDERGAEMAGWACGAAMARLRGIEAAGLALPGDSTTAGVFAHGDLAPVNVLVHGGRVTAVLDLDRARLAEPDYDAAWFAWVVSAHHPGLAADAWRGFTEAAGLDGRSIDDVAWLWPHQLLERAREARDEGERDRWRNRAAAAQEGRARA